MYMGGVGDWADGINNPEAEPEAIASDILLKFEHAWGQIADVRNNHVKWLKAFYGIAEDLPAYKRGTGASNMFVPLMEPLVDTITAKFFLTLLQHNPFIRFESETSEKKSILAARVLERTVKYLISDRIPGAKEALYLWIQDATLYGQGFIHVYFDTITHTRNKTQPLMGPTGTPVFDALGQPIPIEVVEQITDYTGLKFGLIDINNIAIDWSTADWRKSWLIIRERIDPEVYLERVRTSGYTPLDAEQIKGLAVGETDYDNIQIEVDGKSGTTMGGEYNIDRKKIELYHFYGKGYVPYFDKDGKLVDRIRQDCKCIVAGRRERNGERLMVLPPIPFGVKPIAVMKFKPKRDEALGRGVGAQIYELQGELNVTRNQRMDSINFSLNQQYMVSPGAVEDENELNSRMGGVVHLADSMAVVKPMERPPIPVEAWNHEAEIKADAQMVTSSADILRGQMERAETAFTTNLRNTNAGQRLEAIVFRMANEGLRELAETMKALLAEFTPSDNPCIVKLTEDEVKKYAAELGELIDENGYISVSPEILKETIYAIPAIAALDGDNRAKSQELIQLLQTMSPYLKTNPETGFPVGWKDRGGNTIIPDVGYFIREYARLNKMDALNDALIAIPAEVTAEMAAQKAKQQMMMKTLMAQNGQPPAEKPMGQPGTPGPDAIPPQEVAGQSMLTSPSESVAQQEEIEQAIMGG